MPIRARTLNQRNPKPKWSHNGKSRHERGLGNDHVRMREIVLNESPLCEECKRKGYVTPASIADHIKPRSHGGGNERENYAALCVPCHDEKTKRERKRGQS